MTRFLDARFSVGGHSKIYEEQFAKTFTVGTAPRWCADPQCEHARGLHTDNTGACTVDDCPCKALVVPELPR